MCWVCAWICATTIYPFTQFHTENRCSILLFWFDKHRRKKIIHVLTVFFRVFFFFLSSLLSFIVWDNDCCCVFPAPDFAIKSHCFPVAAFIRKHCVSSFHYTISVALYSDALKESNCCDDFGLDWPHKQFDRVAITCCFLFDYSSILNFPFGMSLCFPLFFPTLFASKWFQMIRRNFRRSEAVVISFC